MINVYAAIKHSVNLRYLHTPEKFGPWTAFVLPASVNLHAYEKPIRDYVRKFKRVPPGLPQPGAASNRSILVQQNAARGRLCLRLEKRRAGARNPNLFSPR